MILHELTMVNRAGQTAFIICTMLFIFCIDMTNNCAIVSNFSVLSVPYNQKTINYVLSIAALS